jgi:hypothetical protein
MTDLRQGVTPTQNEVLDLIGERGVMWSTMWDFEKLIEYGAGRALVATDRTNLIAKRQNAIIAAALLIAAADDIGRLISTAAPEGSTDARP